MGGEAIVCFGFDLGWGAVGWGAVGEEENFLVLNYFIYFFYHYNYIFCGNVNLSFYLFKI